MPTIDLGPPRPGPRDLLDGLPRRVALTMPELRYVASAAGDAPLPFETPAAPTGSALDDRLGGGPDSADSTERTAYAATLDRLPDAADSLSRRGLLVHDVVEPGLLGAVGLLATPRFALDLSVVAGAMQAAAWHRNAGDAVAALSTADGVVFELAWFPTWAWADELSASR